MTATINQINYNIQREGADIILIPTENDTHTLVLHNGYECVKAAAAMQARDIYQIHQIASDLMHDYVLMNQSELERIEL